MRARGFLGRREGQRRQLGEARGELARASFELGRGMDLVDQPGDLSLRGVEQTGRQHERAGAAGTERGDQQREAQGRQEIAERAGHRHDRTRVRRAS